jgi:hypothetical protein
VQCIRYAVSGDERAIRRHCEGRHIRRQDHAFLKRDQVEEFDRLVRCSSAGKATAIACQGGLQPQC